jgi:hypothetical protein
LGESEAKISNIYREGASSPPPWGQSIMSITVLNITTMTPPFTRGGAYIYGTIQYIEIYYDFRIRIDYFRDPYPERVPGFSRRKEY